MEIKSLSIGNVQIKNNLFLAPMAGYTDYAFRHTIMPFNVGLAFTELVSAKGLCYGSSGTVGLLYCGKDENTVPQIFGAEPYYMRLACEGNELKKFNIIDINMGCPVPKVFKNGEGSALLCDIKKAETVIKECVKSGKMITVKIRTGLKEGDNIASEYSKMAEQAGAKLITIHGRVRQAYYSGEPDYKAIYNAKKSVNIPVIANGGIFNVSDANKMIENTGADGIMIARGALTNPFIFSNICNANIKESLKSFMLNHLSNMKQLMGKYKSAIEFRKFVPYYFKGMNNLKEVKLELYSSDNADKSKQIIEKNF